MWWCGKASLICRIILVPIPCRLLLGRMTFTLWISMSSSSGFTQHTASGMNLVKTNQPGLFRTGLNHSLCAIASGLLSFVCSLSCFCCIIQFLLSSSCEMVAVSGFEPESEASQTTMLILLHHTAGVPRSNGSDRAKSDSDTEVGNARANPIPPYFSVPNHNSHFRHFVKKTSSFLTFWVF